MYSPISSALPIYANITMSKLLKTFVLVAFCLLMGSCKRQAPQVPSNKGNEMDKNTVSLLAINQNLARKEDGLLEKFALQKNNSFKKSDLGFWYKIDASGNGTKLKDSVLCKFSYKLTSLKGKVLEMEVKQIVIGKKQVVVGLEEGLKLMNKGDSATIIVPWYLAYGMKGNAPLIPPYTSIIYNVRVFD